MNNICCYCGLRPATTRDHVPPKSIFNKPRPDDLITVPCCFECNNEASVSDEKFKAYLGMHVSSQGGEAERLFKEGVYSTVKHNNILKTNIFKTAVPADVTDKNGAIIGKGMSVEWDDEAHKATIDRITRGLFFHHYKKIIPKNIDIEIYWFGKENKGFDDFLEENSIANGAFKYQYNKVEESEFNSLWLYNFYNGHFAGASIMV